MKTRSVLATGLVAILVASASAEDKGRDGGTNYWMRKKLEYSERILGGLANADFEEIGQSARSMSALTKMERWVQASAPGYREQLKTFQTANQQIIQAAEREDLDAATKGFAQLTTSCVNCHRVIRDVQRVGVPKSG